MKQKILIVDDEKKILDLIEFRLKLEGFETLVTESGIEALKIIESHKPDLIVLDVMMPEIDGFEICKKVKANDSSKNIKIILLTAKGQDQDKNIGHAAGADSFMTKPFSPKGLIKNIKKLLNDQ